MRQIISGIIFFLFFMCNNFAVLGQPISNTQYTIENLRKAISADKHDQGAYMALIYNYSLEGRFDRMISVMQDVTRTFGKDENIAVAFNSYAKDLYDRKEYVSAEKIARYVLSVYKDNVDAVLILSKSLLNAGKTSESTRVLDKFLSSHPQESVVYDTLIDHYFYESSYKAAFDTARKAQRYYLDNVSYYFLEGLALLSLDKEQSKVYFSSYYDKLAFSDDLSIRKYIAKELLYILNNPQNEEEFLENFVKSVKSRKCPLSYLIVVLNYASLKYPANEYFKNSLKTERSRFLG